MTTITIDRHVSTPETVETAEKRNGRPAPGRETALRAAARRNGLTMTELAAKIGVTPGHLSQIASGGKRWTAETRRKAEAVLGEVPAQGFVERSEAVVVGESSRIRERARELGMSMRDLAERVGVSYGYMVQASRGHRTMGPKVRARVESALEAPVEIAPARTAAVDRYAVFERLNAHGISQNEAARRAGISSGHLSQIVNGLRDPSPGVLKRLHGVLFRRAGRARRGIVVRGAGGPGSGSIRPGGRVPWGAETEHAYRGLRRQGRAVLRTRRDSRLLRHADPAGDAGRVWRRFSFVRTANAPAVAFDIVSSPARRPVDDRQMFQIASIRL